MITIRAKRNTPIMKIDLPGINEVSRRFYAGHNLADWAEALPAAAALTDADRTALEQAAKHGFTAAFAFPPFALQVETLERLIDETARKPAPIPDNQQYREPFLADDWSKTANGKVLQRTDDLGGREWGPYLYLCSPNPIQKCWGLTGKQIREQFRAKDWRGLTVPEYLILQRYFCEKYGDHRFFEKPEDDLGAHWIWLVDSMDDKNCSVALGSNRGINIQATGINNRERKRAAIGGLIVPLS
jgi:hypothetical protein